MEATIRQGYQSDAKKLLSICRTEESSYLELQIKSHIDILSNKSDPEA